MKLLQWNIWFKEKIENIAKTIKEIDPDIICLQELAFDTEHNKVDTSTYLKKTLEMNMYYKSAQEWESQSKKSQGNGIYSKYPIFKSNFSYLQEGIFDTKDWTKEGRVYIEVVLNILGKNITVGTTHLSYTPAFIDSPGKKVEVDKLINIIKEKDSSYIFTGDLNSPPDHYAIQKISGDLKNAGPDFYEKSWTTKPFDDNHGFQETDLNWRLDYVFHTQDIKAKSSKIIKTQYSDHLPLLIEFEI